MKPRPWLLVTALVALAAALQIPLVGRQSLWVDEIFSLAIATGHSLEQAADIADRTLGDYHEPSGPESPSVFRAYAENGANPASWQQVTRAVFLSDTNPPLYYVSLHGWTRLAGTGDVALRLFSVAWSLGSVVLIFEIGRRLGGMGVAFSAAVLFIFSPHSLYYSTEGRMYSMLWFCLLAVLLLTLMLRDRKCGWGTHAAWVVASAGGLLVHYFFVFPWIALIGVGLLLPGIDRRKWLAMRVGAVALIVSPWYVRVPSSLRNWRVTQDWLNWEPAGFQRLKAIRDLVLQLFSGDGQGFWRGHANVETLELVLFGFLACHLVWRMRRRLFEYNPLLLGLVFFGACAGPVVFDLVRHTYTVAIPRYALAALPAACLLSAVSLNLLPVLPRSGLLACIVLGWGTALPGIYRNDARVHQPISAAAAFVSSMAQPDDLILIQSIPSGVIGFARYASSAIPIVSWVEQLGARQAPSLMPALAKGHRRIWLVKFHVVGATAPAEDWLRAHATESLERKFGVITVTDFRLPDSPPRLQ